MLLKVGELAARTGLTVRTLHHYDEIGLLAPSGRSDSGYRLYSREDVARLHGIQSLRHLGLALKDIARLLAGGADPQVIMGRQIHALEREIAQASELRDRLALMRDGLVAGAEPGMSDWLETLALMNTYGKYFSAAELRLIFENWKPIEAEWAQLVVEVRQAMERGMEPTSAEVQPLASRWMGLMVHWMKGDFALMERWGDMFRQEPSAQGRRQAPEGDMIEFMTKAIDLRKALLAKHVPLEQMRRLGRVTQAQWQALEAKVQDLMRRNVGPRTARGRAVALEWGTLMDQLTCNDRAFRARIVHAYACEPLLRAGASLSAPVRDYIRQAQPTGA